MTNAAAVAEATMNTNTNKPLYELRLSAIGTIDSQAMSVCTGILVPVANCTVGATASITTAGTMPVRRHSTARIAMAAIDNLSISCAPAAASRPEEQTAELQ